MKYIKENSWILWLGLAVILAVIAIFIGVNSKKTVVIENPVNNTVNNIDVTPVEEYEELSVGASEVTSLYNKVNVFTKYYNNEGLTVGGDIGYLYKASSYDRLTIDNQRKLEIAVSYLMRNNMIGKIVDVAEDEASFGSIALNEAMTEIFGADITYTKEDLERAWCGYGHFKYDSTNDIFTADKVIPLCNAILLPEMETKILEARKYEDRIEIDETNLFIYQKDENGIVTYYASYTVREDSDKILTSSSNRSDISIDNFLEDSKLYKFRYTFRLVDGKYIFESIRKVA